MKKIARFLGITVQALILGLLLFIAIGQLITLKSDARIFFYQAF
jgi:hypothetical protein